MCGIVAIHCWRTLRPVEEPLLRALSDAQRHRGPDGEGVHLDGELGLAHRRLAVIDRAGGAQPMRDAAGELAIVFNGEIYDHCALRAELERLGHRFRTASDTEVVLELYRRFGDDCVHRLWGDFAFALWDGPRRRLLAARDRMGVKPLCWTETADGIAIASEEKALLQLPGLARRACPEAVQDYLLTGTVAPPRTFLQGVHALPPGHVLVSDRRGCSIRRYWDVPFVEPLAHELPAVQEWVAERVSAAVAARLVSDVPVGAFLSGGLDSSTVVAYAARASAGALPTYTVRYPEDATRLAGGAAQDGMRGEDAHYAALVARAFGTEHHEVALSTDDLVDGLDRAVWHRDRPLIQLVEHGHAQVYRAARGRVTVLLSGEGGDEVFGGYYYWLARRARENTDFYPWVWRSPTPVPPERAATAYDLLESALSPELGPAASVRARLAAEFEAVIARPATADFVNKLCYAFLAVRLPDFLAMEDRLAMAQGMEVRVPLVDPKVVELVAGLPSAFKMGAAGEKVLLRDHVATGLPAEVRQRVKSPFPTPLDARAFHAHALRAVGAKDARVRRYIEPGLPARLAALLEARPTPAVREVVFRLYTLERWLTIFEVSP